jgi:uncharacterized protein (DUF433 family)
MNGIPCIFGLRIPVATVVGMVAEGMTQEAILRAFSDLEAKDVPAALGFAAEAVLSMKQPLKLNYLWAALCICAAVSFVFRDS